MQRPIDGDGGVAAMVAMIEYRQRRSSFTSELLDVANALSSLVYLMYHQRCHEGHVQQMEAQLKKIKEMMETDAGLPASRSLIDLNQTECVHGHDTIMQLLDAHECTDSHGLTVMRLSIRLLSHGITHPSPFDCSRKAYSKESFRYSPTAAAAVVAATSAVAAVAVAVAAAARKINQIIWP